MSSTSTKRIAIVGGGLTGLTAAWRLQAAGFEVQVFEKDSFVGGRTRSIHQDGFIFDVGAIAMLPTYTTTCALVEELGISAHLHRVTPVIGIPRGGQIHRLDLARPLHSLLTTRLISTGTKLRMLKLLPAMIRAWPLATYQTLTTLAAWDFESIADYVRREMGEEAHEFIAGPIIRGNTLNATECAPSGELLWMLRQYSAPYVFGFDQGINFLAEILGTRVPVELGTEVVAVDKTAEGVSVQGKRADGRGFSEHFDACVLALPPQALLPLATGLTGRQRTFLGAIKPLRSVNLHVGLRKAPAATETFILPPHSEQPVLTTIVMDHIKAPGRAPAGKGVVSFFLRDDWCSANYDRPDTQLKDEILAMARPFIGDISADVESYVVQRWPYAIIKSEVGLYRRMAAYEFDVDPDDRIQIGGDFLSMGMEAAVSSGTLVAKRLCKQLA